VIGHACAVLLSSTRVRSIWAFAAASSAAGTLGFLAQRFDLGREIARDGRGLSGEAAGEPAAREGGDEQDEDVADGGCHGGPPLGPPL
jgi:hypothetical protein